MKAANRKASIARAIANAEEAERLAVRGDDDTGAMAFALVSIAKSLAFIAADIQDRSPVDVHELWSEFRAQSAK